jgi:hypothetical protein
LDVLTPPYLNVALFDDLAVWLKRTWLASNQAAAKAPAEPVADE